MTDWEYHTIKGQKYRDEDKILEELNILGKAGWEMCGVSFTYIIFLKRERR